MAVSEMTPIDWAKRPLEKYADFKGRASRSEFWWYTLALIVLGIALSIVENIVGIDHMFFLYGPLSLLLLVATIVPSLAVMARRLHDTNRSGWWMMILIVPEFIVGLISGMAIASGSTAMLGIAAILGIIVLVAAVVLLVFLVLPGTPGENRFGANPLGAEAAPLAAG